MARSWQYPRWRRVVMQVVLWAVFGLTMGVAALVVKHRRLVGAVELGDPLPVRLPDGTTVRVRLPRGWAVPYDAGTHADELRRADPNGPWRLFEAEEMLPGGPADDADPAAGMAPSGRTLDVFCQRVTPTLSATEFLDQSGLMRGTRPVLPAGPTAADRSAVGGPIAVAGTDGVWRAVRRAVGSQGQFVPEDIAVGVVPPGWAIVVVLDRSTEPDDAEDRDLLRRVAGTVIVVAATPAVRS